MGLFWASLLHTVTQCGIIYKSGNVSSPTLFFFLRDFPDYSKFFGLAVTLKN